MHSVPVFRAAEKGPFMKSLQPYRNDSEAMHSHIAREFHLATGHELPAPTPVEIEKFSGSQFHGGRVKAIEQLQKIDPVRYGRTRNFVSGDVTKLSPWLRHGALSLTEVRDAALSKVQQASQAEKLIAELGWRDYWQRVRAARPEGVWQDFEAPAARHRGQVIDYLPDTVAHGETGLDCIDAFCKKLTHDGWLHNHERMWLASWLVHTRKVTWRVGAAWFLQHLLDADPASNNFSWQWVAGTFSSKPYIFNRENLERFTAGIYCETCPALGHCDFEGTYEQLNEKLFMNDSDEREMRLTIPPVVSWDSSDVPDESLVWMTLDSLSVCSPAKLRFPESPAIFVFDQHWLSDELPSYKRIAFICECLADLPDVEIWFGDTASILQERARANKADAISVANTSCPAVRRVVDRLSSTTSVVPLEWPSFCDASKVKDLGRFSRYWNKVSKTALRPTFADDRF